MGYIISPTLEMRKSDTQRWSNSKGSLQKKERERERTGKQKSTPCPFNSLKREISSRWWLLKTTNAFSSYKERILGNDFN